MSDAVTRVVVRRQMVDVEVYEFEGVVDASAVEDLIHTGEYDPVENSVKQDEIDVLDLRTMTR